MTLCDAGPLYALVAKKEKESARCRMILPALRAPLITTWPCFTEAMYLAYRAGGWSMQQFLWRYVRTGTLRLHLPGPAEEERMPELMEKYADNPMDLADASLVAAAEALNVTRVFTLDTHFNAYRLDGTLPFEIIPPLSLP